MAEKTIYICSICGNSAESIANTIFEKYRANRGTLKERTLKEMPKVEVTISICGPDHDNLICDKCIKKIELLLDQITLRSV